MNYRIEAIDAKRGRKVVAVAKVGTLDTRATVKVFTLGVSAERSLWDAFDCNVCHSEPEAVTANLRTILAARGYTFRETPFTLDELKGR